MGVGSKVRERKRFERFIFCRPPKEEALHEGISQKKKRAILKNSIPLHSPNKTPISHFSWYTPPPKKMVRF